MLKPWEKELKIPIKELINDLELEISYKEEVSYMILGILKSNFPGERRVPLLPEDINDFENELILEFDNQIALFEKLTGQKPNHLNYHHRFDFYQYYPSLAKHLFEKYQLPMRLEKDYHEYPYEYAINQTYFLNTHDDIHKYLIGDIIEMPCHVGFVDQSIMEMSSLNLQRMEDHALVTSSRFKKLYHDLGYQLIGWNQLQKKTRNSY